MSNFAGGVGVKWIQTSMSHFCRGEGVKWIQILRHILVGVKVLSEYTPSCDISVVVKMSSEYKPCVTFGYGEGAMWIQTVMSHYGRCEGVKWIQILGHILVVVKVLSEYKS